MVNPIDFARFDWYEMTFDGEDDGRELMLLSAALGVRPIAARGRNGYAAAQAFDRAGVRLCVVYGSSARAGELHIEVQGGACDELVPVLRRLWPEHRVSRLDVAVDMFASFDTLDAACLAAVESSGVRHSLIVNSEGGATRYLGSPKSEVRVRVYKKSEQLIALRPHLAHEVVAGIVRAEVQVRPSKREVKARAATLSPAACWGFAQWSKTIAAAVLGFDAERTVTSVNASSDWRRIRHYMQRQYGPAVAKRALEVGTVAMAAELLELFKLEQLEG